MKKKTFNIPNSKGLNAYCIEDNSTIKLYTKSKGNEELVATYIKKDSICLINGRRKDPFTVRYNKYIRNIASRYKKHIPTYIVYRYEGFHNHKYYENRYKEPRHHMHDDGSVWYRMPLHSYNHHCLIHETDSSFDLYDYGTLIASYKKGGKVIIRTGTYSTTSCQHFIWFADMICYKSNLETITVWLYI